MSSAIRPLPIEAASQRTENDAIPAGDSGGFAELFDSHIDAVESEEPRDEKPRPEDAATVLGVIVPLVLPLPEPSARLEAPKSSRTAIQAPPEASIAASPPPETGPPITSAALLKSLTPPSDAEQKLPVPTPPMREEIAGKSNFEPENGGGIPVAKHTAMLLMMEQNADESSIEQRLPSSATIVESLPSRPVRWVEPARAPQNADTATPATVSSVEAHIDTPAETPVRVEAPKTPVFETIHEQVRIVKITQQRELQVVLRPDSNTELFLHIRNEGGQIHLQARCERGDFAWLDSQWGAIQQALSAQGVRVEPLESAFRAQNGFSGFNGHHDSRQEAQRPEPLIEIDLPKPSKSSAQADRAFGRGRGWQTWA